MTTLYNLRSAGSNYVIAKFDADLNFEIAYNLTRKGAGFLCDCPANSRSVVLRPCKHKRMLPMMLGAVNTQRFYCPETGTWCEPIVLPQEEPKQPVDAPGVSIQQAQAEVVGQPQPPLPTTQPAEAPAVPASAPQAQREQVLASPVVPAPSPILRRR